MSFYQLISFKKPINFPSLTQSKGSHIYSSNRVHSACRLKSHPGHDMTVLLSGDNYCFLPKKCIPPSNIFRQN